MSAVGDYLIWLEENSHIEFNNHTQEYEWDGDGDPLTDDILYAQYVAEQNNVHDKNGWSPDDFWFKSDGGLTGDALDFLAQEDVEQGFI